MSHKLFRILSVLAILALAFALPGGIRSAIAVPACDSAYVTIAGADITVRPTGSSDTTNLQCAFDSAVAAGPGVNVRLVAGTYHTAQIVVTGFHGKFSGAGMGNTLIFNLSDMYVTPLDFYLNPPSASNPAPILFTFINGDYAISDLAIFFVGDHPAQGWSIYGIEPPLKEFAVAVAILGTEAHAQVDHVLVEGEYMADSLYGYNLIQAFYFEGLIGDPSPAITGSFSVQHSIFRSMVSGTPVFNIANASVVVSHNTFEDTIWGMDGYGIQDSSLEFSNNKTSSFMGIDLYNVDALGIDGSSILIKNNVFRGAYGAALEYSGEGNQCLLLGNNMQEVTEIGAFLGPGIHGCTVVGGSAKTSVLDLGVGNTLTGVNNMGAGVGPEISSWMKMRK